LLSAGYKKRVQGRADGCGNEQPQSLKHPYVCVCGLEPLTGSDKIKPAGPLKMGFNYIYK